MEESSDKFLWLKWGAKRDKNTIVVRVADIEGFCDQYDQIGNDRYCSRDEILERLDAIVKSNIEEGGVRNTVIVSYKKYDSLDSGICFELQSCRVSRGRDGSFYDIVYSFSSVFSG